MIDGLLIGAARVLLRTRSPATAHRIMLQLGRVLPQRRDADDLRRSARQMEGRGTCLTRALALAARAPLAEIVIGVEPHRESLRAHAWLEWNGVPLSTTDPVGLEIARLRGSTGPCGRG